MTPACCPCCGAAFDCGACGPTPCACTSVTLSAALQAELRDHFDGCLCLSCLRWLAQQEATMPAAEPGLAVRKD